MLKKLYILCLICVIQSCITSKAKYSSKNVLNNNPALFTINGAQLENKKSLVGITTQIVSVGLGGYIGYRYFPVALGYTAGKLNASSIGGAVLGGLAGYGVNNSIDFLSGERKQFSVNQSNYNKWKRSFDPSGNYIALNNNYDNLEFADKKNESQFSVKNLQDARYFKNAFPQSQYSKKVFDEAVNISDRYSLQELSKLYPNEDQETLAKKHLVTSKTFSEYIYSISLFKENRQNLKESEKMALRLVKTYSDAEQFLVYFPGSKWKKQVVLNAMQESSDLEIPKIAKLLGSEFYLSENDFKSLESTNNLKRKYLNSQFILNQPKSLYDVEKLYTSFRWLDYIEKPKDVLKKYWDISYKNSSESTTIIKTIENLYKDVSYKDLKITEPDAKNFIKEMLINEANKVYVKSTYTKGTPNPEWEAWLKNDSYSAGIVNAKGEIKYVIYGTVVNNSKFELPLNIISSGTLISTSEIKGTGSVTNFLLKTVEKLSGGQAPTKEVRSLGNKTESFFIPSLPPSRESTYAVLLDFGSGINNQGINFNDLFKASTQISLENVITTIQFSEERPNNSRLKNQDSWQLLAKNGLPNAVLTDLWRGGKEVNDREWREEYSRILEARREAEARFDAEWESKKEQRELEENAKKEFKDYQNFRNTMSFKYLKTVEDKGVLFNDFNGTCPCEKYELRKGNLFFDDTFDIYKDKREQWYVYRTGLLARDIGPYNTSDDLLKYIYNEYYR